METNPIIPDEDCIEVAKSAMRVEAEAIQVAAGRLNGDLRNAVHILMEHKGKIIVTGVGKSGLIGQKITATLCSTGSPAIFLHAGEAIHGDLGVYTPGDPTILISKSGASPELLRLIPVLRQFHSPLVGILGSINSPLARRMDVILDARVEREADPLNLAPTTSSTVALAIGDALAVALMRGRGFSQDDFARFHPGGQLGRSLLLRVMDVMHPANQVACVSEGDLLREVVIEMTRHPLGAACILDEEGHLTGLITDGDLRRALRSHTEIIHMNARQVMTSMPITINPANSLQEAAHLMENRPSQISVLPVLDEEGIFLGLLRIHDIYQADLQ